MLPLFKLEKMCTKRDLIDDPLHVATKEIVCYKVVVTPYRLRRKFKTKLLRFFGKLKHYQTYYQDTPITIGTTVFAEPAYTKGELEFIEKHQPSLNEGFIHSFKHKEDAIRFVKVWRRHTVVVQCVIPVDAYYFEGHGGLRDFEEHYASTALKYVKVIKS